MKYWLDTEFIEDGKTIDLISIGIVCDDGREYYAINRGCDFSKASDWVKKNVISHLPQSFVNPQTASPSEIQGMLYWKDKRTIVEDVAEFVGCVRAHPSNKYRVHGETPEFWAYYADYDWVVFCQLFGTMMELPEGFPMYCRDIKQECDRLGSPELPKQEGYEHDALSDARWNKRAYDFLVDFEKRFSC